MTLRRLAKRGIGVLVTLIPLLGAVAAQAQDRARDLPRYEASHRHRTAMEAGCLADEVVSGPQCVKKCQGGFRLDLVARPPECVGLKSDAKYVPPKPEYTPPTGRTQGAAGS